ncbi:Alpha-galactosidase [Forsythia ovata]|uniref:Alpha-galactosidase n=1 Tax=Forsythia ovata TaxID=205694 RepID=A0ABD1T821_9LAMI
MAAEDTTQATKNKVWIEVNLTFQVYDAFISTDLAKLGYIYVNIDDCWSEMERNSKGQLVHDPKTFSSGIKALADYVHSKGLELGIYTDAGKYGHIENSNMAISKTPRF